MSQYEKRGYLLENFRLFHLRTENPTAVDYHYHDFCKMILIVSGGGSYFVDGHRYLLQSGDIILLGSNSVHRPELDASSVYERIIIYISPDFLKNASSADCDLVELFSAENSNILRLKDKQRKRIFDMTSTLEKDLNEAGYGREILSNADLLRLLVAVGRILTDKGSHRPSPEIPTNNRVVEIMRYIDNNISEELNVEKIAQQFYISKYHMMRLFHTHTGETIHNYLTIRRLLLAKELIDGGMRATEACYQCGFHSYSSFTRAYSKHLGTTPTGRIDAHRVKPMDFE